MPVSLKPSTLPLINLHLGQFGGHSKKDIPSTGEGTGNPMSQSQSSCNPKGLYAAIAIQHSHQLPSWRETIALRGLERHEESKGLMLMGTAEDLETALGSMHIGRAPYGLI